MKKSITVLILIIITQGGALASGGGDAIPDVDGLAIVSPVQERSCIALRVDVPVGKALSGVQWFNGATDQTFPRILVASGSGETPPLYEDAMVLAEDVTGLYNAWSEMEFNAPVGSQSGTLFIILQYPAFYVPPEEELSIGVGFREFEGESGYFVSRDGDSWYKLSSNYEFLLNPIYVDSDPTMVALSSPEVNPELIINEGLPESTSFMAYPNPFNPTIQLQLELKESANCEMVVYDLRGRLVKEIHSGPLPAGTTVFQWDGRDNGGRRLSSGVYWTKVIAGDLSFTERMVMLK